MASPQGLPQLGCLDDAVLARSAADGDRDAFAQLDRRHVGAAWRLACAVVGDPHDAADAVADAFSNVLLALARRAAGSPETGDASLAVASFRAYLLAATRNAAVDVIRARQRVLPSGDPREWAELPGSSGYVPPVDTDGWAVMAAALAGLPERWRSVLWLTEVEEYSAREVAGMLGIMPNHVHQLACRARAALLAGYLQAHVPPATTPECSFSIDHLGAYVSASMPPGAQTRLAGHLSQCAGCRERKAALHDLRTSLARS